MSRRAAPEANSVRCWKQIAALAAGLVGACLGVSLLVAALCLVTSPTFAAETPSAEGEWWTPGFGARVRIEPCAEALCGHIVWIWDEAPRDVADKAPLVGRRVIAQMHPDSPSRWSGGRLYNPEDGREYNGSLQLASPTRLVLEGCVLMICRRQVWRRVDAARCPPVEPAVEARR